MATVSRFPDGGPNHMGGNQMPPAAPNVEEQAFDPRRLFTALLRRKYMIVGFMVIGLGLAVLHASRLVPLYSADVTMLIEGARQNVVNIESVAQGITPDYYTNETQVY